MMNLMDMEIICDVGYDKAVQINTNDSNIFVHRKSRQKQKDMSQQKLFSRMLFRLMKLELYRNLKCPMQDRTMMKLSAIGVI